MLSPFEKNYRLKHIWYSHKLDWGLYVRLNFRHWFKCFWGHPEADVIWYDVGPLAFYTSGRD